MKKTIPTQHPVSLHVVVRLSQSHFVRCVDPFVFALEHIAYRKLNAFYHDSRADPRDL